MGVTTQEWMAIWTLKKKISLFTPAGLILKYSHFIPGSPQVTATAEFYSKGTDNDLLWAVRVGKEKVKKNFFVILALDVVPHNMRINVHF